MQKHSTKEGSLAWFLRLGIYIAIFTPLIIFRDFISPFHFGKVIIFRSLIEVLGAAYLILILKDRSYLPRWDKMLLAFTIFVLAFALTTVTSALRYPSFWGFLERMGGLWTFLHYFLFYIILTSVLTKQEHWQKLIDLTILVGILSAFYGFAQKTNIDFFLGSGNRERIFGTVGNAALFAGYELFIVFLSLIKFFAQKINDNRKKLYGLAFMISSIAVLLTAVRGSLLGYGLGLAIFTLLWLRQTNPRAGKYAVTVFTGLFIGFIVFSLLFRDSSFVQQSRYLRRITDLSLNSPTVQTRFWAWQAGVNGWNDSAKTIILGWGPENFNIPFSKYFNPQFFAGPGAETLFDRAHNMFIEILVTMGIVGLAAYTNIFITLFIFLRRLLKNNDLFVYSAGFISATIAYIIHNSFIFDTSPNLIVFFSILGFVSYLNFGNKGEVHEVRPVLKNPAVIKGLGLALTTIVAGIIYTTAILPARANYATTRAIVRSWEGDVDGAIEKYKEALSYNVPGKYEYRNRFAQYLVGVGAPSVKEEKIREVHLYALKQIDKNIKENPIDYLPYLYGSRLNIMLGKDDPESPFNDRALEYSMKALELSPTFIRTYFEIAQVYLNKKDYKTAIEYFKKAVDLNPDTGISHAYLGAAKIESGDLSGAEDLDRAINSKNSYYPREADFYRLVQAYAKLNDFAKIAWVYEQMIIVNPKNPQYYASLATAYASLGRIDEAVAMARKAVEVDPSFESDARIFLRSLGYDL